MTSSAAVLYLPENTKGRDFVVGDIHGMFHLLDRAMKRVEFNPACDRIISVGDLINRGPQSERCLEFLRQPWFFAARGNHEKYFTDTFKNGAPVNSIDKRHMEKYLRWTFNQEASDFREMKEKIAAMPLAIEIATPEGAVGIVHADIPQGMDWQSFTKKLAADHKPTRATATEGRERIKIKNTAGVKGIRHVFFGHTIQTGGPQILGNCFFIDTGAYHVQDYPNNSFSLTLTDIRVTAEDVRKSANSRRDNCTIIMPGIQKP